MALVLWRPGGSRVAGWLPGASTVLPYFRSVIFREADSPSTVRR